MLNKEKHRIILNELLIAIYRNNKLASHLGFKGGTACMYFYGLDRFSTDLDFDCIDQTELEAIRKEFRAILLKHGIIKEEYLRANTLFFLLSYGIFDTNIKIEISLRDYPSKYVIINWKWLSLRVMEKSSMLANKLVALTERDANRDIYDVYFFLKNSWEWDENIIRYRTGLPMKDFWIRVIDSLEKRRWANLLERLGEVLKDAKQKSFAKNKLLDELIWKIQSFIE